MNSDLERYVKMGTESALKKPCVICGGKSVIAGICLADGTPAARQAMGTPNMSNPYSHRFIFYGVCENCQHDPNLSAKIVNVIKKVLQGLLGRKQNVNNHNVGPTPLVDGQTFSL